ncbi:GNAT family N-acetyltransferase [Streptomyces beijiangensis]|uniref:GNAT family N-acetyltransferase n=1 Tax=Streptomyces beijiangensis TaxID=163361 RepID=A0A939FF70_9ACTN|nr:GNAT family N-acetyltransferase [Streptomyces beijiangensis]MBO0517046.1 GNAT family N-acetyltransferase [Streptomyces beijiangensis]
MTVNVRTITDTEAADWRRALNTGFLRPPHVTDEEVANWLPYIDLNRTRGAFDGARCVATFRSFAQEITVPGGASLPADAISNVTVSPTHRRRGLLGRMMAADLKDARERGDVLATLIAAEYPIYGRYGFGPAAQTTEWTVDVPRAALDPRWSGPDCGGRIDLVDHADVYKLGPELHDRVRRSRAGAVSRDDRWWKLNTGQLRDPGHPWKDPFHVVYRSVSGEVEGLLTYTADDRWGDAKQPLNTASVQHLLAVSPAAERALWTYVCSVDWITSVRSGSRAPDDLLPLLLPDPRAARITTQADFLWVRVLDVVRALEARTYTVTASLVIEVVEDGASGAGLSAGRYRLDASPDGAVCAPSAESPDVTLDVRELGALYLGDESAVRLAALGRIGEGTAGAVLTLEALFRTAARPWCPDVF